MTRRPRTSHEAETRLDALESQRERARQREPPDLTEEDHALFREYIRWKINTPGQSGSSQENTEDEDRAVLQKITQWQDKTAVEFPLTDDERDRLHEHLSSAI